MITENAVVERIEGEDIWVQTQRQSTCGSCAAQKGCGTATIGKVVGLRSTKIRLLGEEAAKTGVNVGDQVLVGLQENAMLRGAFMVYAVPLLLLIFFSAIASISGYPEPIVIAAAALGLLLGGSILRVYTQRIRYNPAYQPVLLKRLTAAESVVSWS